MQQLRQMRRRGRLLLLLIWLLVGGVSWQQQQNQLQQTLHRVQSHWHQLVQFANGLLQTVPGDWQSLTPESLRQIQDRVQALPGILEVGWLDGKGRLRATQAGILATPNMVAAEHRCRSDYRQLQVLGRVHALDGSPALALGRLLDIRPGEVHLLLAPQKLLPAWLASGGIRLRLKRLSSGKTLTPRPEPSPQEQPRRPLGFYQRWQQPKLDMQVQAFVPLSHWLVRWHVGALPLVLLAWLLQQGWLRLALTTLRQPRLGERALRRAWQQGQLQLAYTPVWSLAQQQWVAIQVEWLWRHPLQGDLPEDLWLPLVQRLGWLQPLRRQQMQQIPRDCPPGGRQLYYVVRLYPSEQPQDWGHISGNTILLAAEEQWSAAGRVSSAPNGPGAAFSWGMWADGSGVPQLEHLLAANLQLLALPPLWGAVWEHPASYKQTWLHDLLHAARMGDWLVWAAGVTKAVSWRRLQQDGIDWVSGPPWGERLDAIQLRQQLYQGQPPAAPALRLKA